MAISCLKRSCHLAANVMEYIWIIWGDSLIFLLPSTTLSQRHLQYGYIYHWCLGKTELGPEKRPATFYCPVMLTMETWWVKAVEIGVDMARCRDHLWSVILKSSPCGYFIQILGVINGLKRTVIQCAVSPTSHVRESKKIFC